jgi:hypothetical protein
LVGCSLLRSMWSMFVVGVVVWKGRVWQECFLWEMLLYCFTLVSLSLSGLGDSDLV